MRLIWSWVWHKDRRVQVRKQLLRGGVWHTGCAKVGTLKEMWHTDVAQMGSPFDGEEM